MIDAVSHGINHPMRRLIIEALWHGGEPLSATHFHREYVDDDQATLSVIGYHLRQLELDGITKAEGLAEEGEQRYVLAGPNSAEAVRRLKLAHPGESQGNG